MREILLLGDGWHLWGKVWSALPNEWQKRRNRYTNKTGTNETDDKTRDQQGTDRCAPANLIYTFNRHDLKDQYVNASDCQDGAKTKAYVRNGGQQSNNPGNDGIWRGNGSHSICQLI